MPKITVITGAGTGIGRAIAHKMAENNHNVLIAGRREAPLRETAERFPDKIDYVSADIAQSPGRLALKEKLGTNTLQYLVHNAAVLGPIQDITSMGDEEWQNIMNINLNSVLFLTRDLLPNMDHARILHISSGAAHYAIKGWGGYCVSKAALHMLYKMINEELDPAKAICGSLRPGIVNTPMQKEIRSADLSENPHLQKFHDLYEQEELVEPGQVADFVYWALTAADHNAFTQKEMDIRDNYHA